MTTPDAIPLDQRRALIQQRIAQRQAQGYAQSLIRHAEGWKGVLR